MINSEMCLASAKTCRSHAVWTLDKYYLVRAIFVSFSSYCFERNFFYVFVCVPINLISLLQLLSYFITIKCLCKYSYIKAKSLLKYFTFALSDADKHLLIDMIIHYISSVAWSFRNPTSVRFWIHWDIPRVRAEYSVKINVIFINLKVCVYTFILGVGLVETSKSKVALIKVYNFFITIINQVLS